MEPNVADFFGNRKRLLRRESVRKTRRRAPLIKPRMRRKSDLQLRQDVAERIRLARLAAGFSNASEFARLLKIQPQRLSSWEQGDALPNTPRLWSDLADALGVTTDYILRGRMDGLTVEVRAALMKAKRNQ